MRLPTFLLLMTVFASPLLYASEGKDAISMRRGAELLEARNYQKAVKEFAQAVRLNPDNVEALKGLGTAYLKLGSGDTAINVEMLDNAIAAYTEVLRLAPASAEIRYQLGLIYLTLKDRSNAVKQYEALQAMDAALAEQLQAAISAYVPPKSFKTLLPSGAAGGKSTRVTIAGNHVLVPVSFTHGDRSIQATLLLDTGASYTLISSTLAKRLNIDVKGGTPVQFQVVGGATVQGWHTKLDRLEVGPHAKAGIDVAVVNETGAVPFDGLLGMNFLRNYKYSVDFSNQVINWGQ